jgi:hypothetical protein
MLSMAFLACGASVKRPQLPANADKRTLAEASFDPLKDQNDEEVITSNVPPAREVDDSANVVSYPRQAPARQKVDQYFSVQVFASKSSSEAREFKNSLPSTIDEEIRIDYQAPYYKVCIGKAATFEDAEALLKKINGMGYSQAWLVRVRK